MAGISFGHFFVGIGWAQPIIDFIFWAHMVKPVYLFKPFDSVAAVTLIVITTVTGYVFGSLGAIHLEQIAPRVSSAGDCPAARAHNCTSESRCQSLRKK